MTLRNKNMCLIVDFYYRNWLFLVICTAVVVLFDSQLLHCQPITSSSTSISYHSSNHHHSSQLSSSFSSNSICSHLKDNFRFDFALNQHIAERHSADFRHYLLSKHQFLRFELPREDVQLTPILIANQTLLESLDFDLGFSLLGDVEGVTRMCFVKFHPGTLRCLQLDQYQGRPLSDQATFRHLLPKKSFPLALDYFPTVAFQDVRFTDYPNSKYQVVFVEQTLSKNSTMRNRKFHRRIEIYNFKFTSKADELYLEISNFTHSSELPEYLNKYSGLIMPDTLELTGVFNWKAQGGGVHEYLLLAFNGSHHLYCLNSDCAREEGYKPWLQDCRPSQEVLKQEIKNPDEDYLWAINHHPKYEAVEGKGPSLIEYVSGLITAKSNRPFSLYLLSGMFFLIVCLGFLVLGVCYYSIKEVHLQERQAKAVYEKAILLSAINSTRRKVEDLEDQSQERGDNSAQETTVSTNSVDTSINSSTINSTSNSFEGLNSNLNSNTPLPLPPLPPTPPPELEIEREMVRIPLEAILVNGGKITTTTVASVNKVNSTGDTNSPAVILQSSSSAV